MYREGNGDRSCRGVSDAAWRVWKYSDEWSAMGSNSGFRLLGRGDTGETS